MNSIVDVLNAAGALGVQAALWPVSGWSHDWQLIWISALSGVLFLVVYGAVSSQHKIKGVKRQIAAALLEVVLFRHDLRALFKAQSRLFVYAGAYFIIAIPPILVLLVPCLLLLAQLNLRFAYRPLNVGEQSIVKAKVQDRRLLYRVSLEVPQNMESTPPLRIPETQEVMWRLRAKQDLAPAEINLKLGGGKEFKRPLALADKSALITTQYYRDWWWRILYPDTAMKAAGDLLLSFSISYPEQQHSLLGLQMHWVLIFAIVSILSGIVASRVLGVEI